MTNGKRSAPALRSHLLPAADPLARLPYWLLAMILLGLGFLWTVATNSDYRVILAATSRGILTTVYVSFVSYLFATLLGLLVGLLRVSAFRPLREIASFYIEIVRGVPMLVILYYIAFVGAPALVEAVNWTIRPLTAAGILAPLSIRNMPFAWRAVLALTVGYSAFIAEIFRAGIESIPRGQMEAALATGLSRLQAMRLVILPQAVRNVLPALGNELVAMIKDSALVSALGVQDITLMGKVYSASTFRFFETYNVVAFLYLIMTVSLSLAVRRLEAALQRRRRSA